MGAPLQTTRRSGDRPNNTAFTPDGRRAYVVNNGSGAKQVTVIDAASFEVVNQIEQDAEQGLAPHAIAFEPGTGRMFVANKDGGTISAIDTETDTVVGYVAVGEEPHCLTLGPDGRIYVTEKQGSTVMVIDPRTLAVTLRIADPALHSPPPGRLHRRGHRGRVRLSGHAVSDLRRSIPQPTGWRARQARAPTLGRETVLT